MRYALVALMSFVFVGEAFVTEADAFIFRKWRQRRNCNTSYTSNVGTYNAYTVGDLGNDPQAVAQRKAEIQAARGACFHPGGGMGGCSYEGVGASTYSAQAALDNCCFSGQRQIVAQAVVKGSNGWWYACRLFR